MVDDKKKFNRTLLQTIFDILEIGAAAAIGITNGERAKEVIGIALGGIQATRTSLVARLSNVPATVDCGICVSDSALIDRFAS